MLKKGLKDGFIKNSKSSVNDSSNDKELIKKVLFKQKINNERSKSLKKINKGRDDEDSFTSDDDIKFEIHS
jgi:hypothetical protein